MKGIKDYVGEMFVGGTYRFKCDCLVPMDFVGTVKDYEISGSEILLVVQHGEKIIRLGLNHPNLMVQKL